MATSPLTTPFAPALAKLSTQDHSSTDTANAYAALLDTILTSTAPSLSASDLLAWLHCILGGSTPVTDVPFPHEALPLLALRPLLSKLSTLLPSVPDNDTRVTAARAAIDLIAPRQVTFEEQDTSLKLALADFLQADDDYSGAAAALRSVSLEHSSRAISDADRARIWIRIVRCHLEEDDSTSAGAYLGRIKNVMHNVAEPDLRLQFQLCSARILDAQRSFLDAASAYHAVSHEALVDEDDRLQTLAAAMKCAVLAPAGPLRARLLARLYQDERAPGTDHFQIIENIFLDRLLAADEVARFADALMPHQKALTADGSTVLDRAVLEHNLLAASRVYTNISTENLGALLGVDAERAETYAASMIEQRRLAGHIDQIDGLIFFERVLAERNGVGAGAGEKGRVNGVGMEVRRWEGDVAGVAEEVERVASMVQGAFPEFYAREMARV